MRKIYAILVVLLMAMAGCQMQMRPSDDEGGAGAFAIERFDRMEHLYLTTGDFAALQQLKTLYPAETRMLLEDVLQLGPVDAPDINARFRYYFQDTTLQALMADVVSQYEHMDDLNRQLAESFGRLRALLPGIHVPRVYTQIGALNQSIIVGDDLLGISLDKYLGANHPLYLRYGYTERQRQMMTRSYIVPDCLGFYLLSLYPLAPNALQNDSLRHDHMGRIQYVVNRAMGQNFFTGENVEQVQAYMKAHSRVTVDSLLSMTVLP